MTLKIFLGNASHNLVDGLALATAFQASASLGWIMSLALLSHEIPKSVVSLVLLKEGKEKAVAFIWNLTSSAFTLLGALVSVLALSFLQRITPFALAAGSAFFLYLALTDLVPRQRRRMERKEALAQAGLVLAGALLLWILPHHG
jgi:zinc and cadmium transporter